MFKLNNSKSDNIGNMIKFYFQNILNKSSKPQTYGSPIYWLVRNDGLLGIPFIDSLING